MNNTTDPITTDPTTPVNDNDVCTCGHPTAVTDTTERRYRDYKVIGCRACNWSGIAGG